MITKKRAGGILLHISSLPGRFGIGTLGKDAYRFVDFLKKSGQSYWQILPLGPTGYADSPYQSFSSAAGNPYFIDLDILHEEGLIEKYSNAGLEAAVDQVDYELLFNTRGRVLRAAFLKGFARDRAEIDAFTEKNSDWLPDYAFFMAIKSHFNMVSLSDWPDMDIRLREPAAMERYKRLLADEIDYHRFLQYHFYRQWSGLRRYANENGVKIIGDIPIYVSPDSSECWARPELFLLDGNRSPVKVAGVPPDSFSSTGQLWGNPLYDWARHESNGFSWWIWRICQMSKLYDTVRIDHFRGFESYWAIPAGAETAVSGEWMMGPAMKLIRAIRKELPDVSIIAEDLGDIDDGVRNFVKESGFPGMKVLVDAFDPDADSDFLPHNYTRGSVCYTSTHDTMTFLQWFVEKASVRERDFCAEYARIRLEEGICWGIIKTAWASPAAIAITPLQDVLGLGRDSRMNFPSTAEGNWRWRVRESALNADVSRILYGLSKTYRRL